MISMVLDTNVLIAARRSAKGASNTLLRHVPRRSFQMVASVPLFLEYEAVLTRPEHLLSGSVSREQIAGFLNYLAGLIVPVRLNYLWRPQLADPADEMVLETAINGRAACLVTFNARHFAPASKFGIDVISPAEAVRRIA